MYNLQWLPWSLGLALSMIYLIEPVCPMISNRITMLLSNSHYA